MGEERLLFEWGHGSLPRYEVGATVNIDELGRCVITRIIEGPLTRGYFGYPIDDTDS